MNVAQITNAVGTKQTRGRIFVQPDIIEEFQLVPSELVDRFLILYPPDKRMITRCQYSNGKLQAHLIPRDVEYSTTKLDYYSASQLVLAISQMGYLLGGLAILDDGFESLPRQTYETYLKRLRASECYYIKLDLTFGGKLLKDEEQKITLSCSKAICTHTRMMAKMEAAAGTQFTAEARLFVHL